MTQEPDVHRRKVAVRALFHIRTANAFSALAPCLRDVDIEVRALIPDALERSGGRAAAVIEISSAVRAGFPSVNAILMLRDARPFDLSVTLTEMLENWSPQLATGRIGDLIVLSLRSLLDTVIDVRRALMAVCRLIHCVNEPNVVLVVIEAIETLATRCRPPEPMAMEAIAGLLTNSYAIVRRTAAASLERMGNPYPARVLEYLNSAKPQDNFFSQLQVILRGGRDAGQAASQAMQQVTRWIARITSDAPRGDLDPLNARFESVKTDPRLPTTLAHMLSAGVSRSSPAADENETEERARFIAAVLCGVATLGLPTASATWSDLVKVLHLSAESFTPTGGTPNWKCHESIAAAAIETVLSLYGADCFGLLLEPLYSPRGEVVRTGIAALGILGDTRAIPHLRTLASNTDHPASQMAAQAIAQIKRTNPEMMTLLRGSASAGPEPRTLLRAASGQPDARSSANLLRPTYEATE